MDDRTLAHSHIQRNKHTHTNDVKEKTKVERKKNKKTEVVAGEYSFLFSSQRVHLLRLDIPAGKALKKEQAP